MHKNAKRIIPKFSTILLFGLICPCKKLRRQKAEYVCRFAHGVTHSLSDPRAFLREAPFCKKLTPKLVPIRPKNLPQHVGAMSWHHAKFHDFQVCFELHELKNQVYQSFRPSQYAHMFEFHSHLSHGTYKFTQGHTCDFINNFGALEHVLVVQIWIMHTKCPKLN